MAAAAGAAAGPSHASPHLQMLEVEFIAEEEEVEIIPNFDAEQFRSCSLSLLHPHTMPSSRLLACVPSLHSMHTIFHVIDQPPIRDIFIQYFLAGARVCMNLLQLQCSAPDSATVVLLACDVLD